MKGSKGHVVLCLNDNELPQASSVSDLRQEIPLSNHPNTTEDCADTAVCPLHRDMSCQEDNRGYLDEGLKPRMN